MDFLLDSQHGDLDCYQNLITCSFYHPGLLHKISVQPVHKLLSNVANRQTSTTENIYLHAKEVIR